MQPSTKNPALSKEEAAKVAAWISGFCFLMLLIDLVPDGALKYSLQVVSLIYGIIAVIATRRFMVASFRMAGWLSNRAAK
jgi:hypothetical protein